MDEIDLTGNGQSETNPNSNLSTLFLERKRVCSLIEAFKQLDLQSTSNSFVEWTKIKNTARHSSPASPAMQNKNKVGITRRVMLKGRNIEDLDEDEAQLLIRQITKNTEAYEAWKKLKQNIGERDRLVKLKFAKDNKIIEIANLEKQREQSAKRRIAQRKWISEKIFLEESIESQKTKLLQVKEADRLQRLVLDNQNRIAWNNKLKLRAKHGTISMVHHAKPWQSIDSDEPLEL